MKFRDIDPLPHGSDSKVQMLEKYKQTRRLRTPSLSCTIQNMPFEGVPKVFLQKVLVSLQNMTKQHQQLTKSLVNAHF